MQISSTSWHMRVDRWVIADDYTPKNLCQHFWTTIASVLAFIGVIVTAPIWWTAKTVVKVLGWGIGRAKDWGARHEEGGERFNRWTKKWLLIPLGVLAILYAIGWAAFMLWLLGTLVLEHILTTALITSGAAGCLTLLIGLALGWQVAKEHLNGRPKKERAPKVKETKPPGEPSLFWAWFWAKKHRVCPLIAVTEYGGHGSITATD